MEEKENKRGKGVQILRIYIKRKQGTGGTHERKKKEGDDDNEGSLGKRMWGKD